MKEQEVLGLSAEKQAEKDTSEKAKKRLKIRLRLWLASFAVISVFSALFLYFFDLGKELENIISTLMTTSITAFFGSLLLNLELKQHFVPIIKENLEKVIEKKVNEKMPKRYRNLSESGIIDGFSGMEFEKIRKNLDNSMNCPIIFYKMWISDLDAIEPAMIKAVKNGCNIRVLLLNPEARATIDARSRVLNTRDSESIINDINGNIDKIGQMIQHLGECDCKDGSLKLKVHNSFIPCSMIAIDSVIHMGLYLNGVLSTQNIHFRFAGRYRTHANALFSHFEAEWAIAKEPERLKTA